MTREELIAEVYLKWKPGDVLEYRWHSDHMLYADGKWFVEPNIDDPINHKTDLSCRNYRIKPRTVKYVIEVSENCKADSFNVLAGQLAGSHGGVTWSDDFIEAIRNAKPLAGGVS